MAAGVVEATAALVTPAKVEQAPDPAKVDGVPLPEATKADQTGKDDPTKAGAEVPKPQAPPLFKKKPQITNYPFTEEVDVRYLRRLPIPLFEYPHVNWRAALNGTHGISPLTLIERESGAAILIRRNGVAPQKKPSEAQSDPLAKAFFPAGYSEVVKKGDLPMPGDQTGQSPNVSNVALPPTAPASPTLDKPAAEAKVKGEPKTPDEVATAANTPGVPALTKVQEEVEAAFKVSFKAGDNTTPLENAAKEKLVTLQAGGGAMANQALEMTPINPAPVDVGVAAKLADSGGDKKPLLEILRELSGNTKGVDLDDDVEYKEPITRGQVQMKQQEGGNLVAKTEDRPFDLHNLFRNLPMAELAQVPPPPRGASSPAEQAYQDLLKRHQEERLRLVNEDIAERAHNLRVLEDLDEELIQLIEVQQMERRRAKQAIETSITDGGLHFLVLAQHSAEAEDCIDRLRHLLDMIVEENEDGWTTSNDGGDNDVSQSDTTKESGVPKPPAYPNGIDVRASSEANKPNVAGKMSAVVEERTSALAAGDKGAIQVEEVKKREDLKSIKDGVDGKTQVSKAEIQR